MKKSEPAPPSSASFFRRLFHRIRHPRRGLRLLLPWLKAFLLIGMLALLIGFGLHWISLNRSSVILIQVVSVPSSLVDQGFSPKAAQQGLFEQLHAVYQTSSGASYQGKAYGRQAEFPFRLESSHRSSFLEFLGLRPGISYLRAHLLQDQDSLQLAILGRQGNPIRFCISTQPDSGQSALAALPALLHRASLAIWKQEDPLIWAGWQLQQGATITAMHGYEQALSQATSALVSHWAQTFLAQSLIQLGDLHASLEVLEDLLEEVDTHPAVQLTRAEWYALAGDTVQALAAFQQSARCAATNDLDFLESGGQFLMQLGQIEAARQKWELAARHRPLPVPILVAWAQSFRGESGLSPAFALFEEAMHAAPDRKTIARQYQHFLLEAAEARLRSNLRSEAWSYYLRLMEADPFSAMAQGLFEGYLYRKQPVANRSIAVESLQPESLSIEDQRRWERIMLVHADYLLAEKQLAAAERLWESAPFPALHIRLVKAYQEEMIHSLEAARMEAFQHAAARLDRLGVGKEAWPPLWQANWERYAIQQAATGDYQQGADIYGALLKMDPGEIRWLLKRAQLLGELGYYELANQDFARAYQMNGNLLRVVSHWADMWFEAGDYPKAIEKYELAQKLEGVDVRMMKKWALALRQEGNYARASQQLWACLDRIDEHTIPSLVYQLYAAEIHMEIGYCSQKMNKKGLKEKHYREAELLLDSVLVMAGPNPEHAEACLLRARLAAYAEEGEAVVDWVAKAMENGLSPDPYAWEEEPFRPYQRRLKRLWETEP